MHPSIRKSRLRGGRVGPTCTSACLPYAGTKLQARMALRILLEYEYQCVYSIFLMKRQWGRGHLLKHREGRRWQHELAHPARARQLCRRLRPAPPVAPDAGMLAWDPDAGMLDSLPALPLSRLRNQRGFVGLF